MIKTHYVYILECGDGTYYTGYTIHLIDRYIKHCSGKARCKYTRGRNPLDLVYFEIHPNKSSALKREYQIKKLSRKDKLKLIKQK